MLYKHVRLVSRTQGRERKKQSVRWLVSVTNWPYDLKEVTCPLWHNGWPLLCGSKTCTSGTGSTNAQLWHLGATRECSFLPQYLCPNYQEVQSHLFRHLEERRGGGEDGGGQVETTDCDRGLGSFKFWNLRGRNLIIQKAWSASGLPRGLPQPKGEVGFPGKRERQGGRREGRRKPRFQSRLYLHWFASLCIISHHFAFFASSFKKGPRHHCPLSRANQTPCV